MIDRIVSAILIGIYLLLCKIVLVAWELYPFSVAFLFVYLVYMIVYFIRTLVYGKS